MFANAFNKINYKEMCIFRKLFNKFCLELNKIINIKYLNDKKNISCTEIK